MQYPLQSHTAASLIRCPIHWHCCCCHRKVYQIDCCAKQSGLLYRAKSPLSFVAHKLYKLVFPAWLRLTCGVHWLVPQLHNKHLDATRIGVNWQTEWHRLQL